MASDQIKVILAAHKPPPFQLAFVNSHSRHFPPFGTMSKQQPAFRQPQQHHYKHNDNNLSTMQPTPAIARFIEIPELVGHLAHHYLNHRSISRLMRTSRQMYAFCTPTFYYNIYAGYRHGRRNLFASKESIDALGRNVDLVRVLELHMLDMVYYINCVFASQDQPSTLPPPAPADTSSSTGEQEVWTKVSRRPRWLALPHPQHCTVYPISPMTLLTRLVFNLSFFVSSDQCPYLLPPYMDPRATLVQVVWLLDLSPHLLELSLNNVLMKDHRDIRLLSKALFELKLLQKAKFGFIQLRRRRMNWRSRRGRRREDWHWRFSLPVHRRFGHCRSI
ncbi:MAG: hypothetical protein JOS17DRAFT_760697 [Linnemannia elongata]|nr:MAG: hypothetical protein JOS17DRAFT_760697 [Linnemannia elongata]